MNLTAEERLRVVADTVPALLSYIDRGLVYRWANGGYQRWFGQTPASIAGRHVREVLGDAAWEAVEPYMRRALAGEVVTYEQRLPYRDSGPRWVRVTYTPDVADGAVRGFVVLVNDIGEQKEAEARIATLTEHLHARIEELQTLFDVLPVGVFLARDPACAEMTANQVGAQMLGVEPGANPSKTGPGASSLPFRAEQDGIEVAPEDLPMQRAARSNVRIAGEEIDVVRSDGSRLSLWTFVSPLYDPAGEVRGAIGAFVDATERKRVEKALRESEAEYRALFEMASVGAAEADAATGRFTRVNQRFCEITGYRESELLQRTFSDITHPDDLDADRDRRLEALRSIGGWQSEKRYLRPDGSVVWVLVTGRVARPAGRPDRTFAHIVDITDRKLAEDALRRLEDELRARVEELRREHREKDQFIAILAHELRNPLAPIRSAIELLRLRPPEDPALLRMRDVIGRQTDHLTRLVDDLLDLSRITRGTIELRTTRIEVRQIVESALETSQPLLDKHGHRLTVELPDAPLQVEGDLTRLAQVVANLLNNAAKYTEPGGCVRVSAAREGEWVVVRVVDDGIGIPADMLPHVFDMFAQVDRTGQRAQGGLGIGLTIVRRLVEMHGGEVEAKSDGPGRGTEMSVRLPPVETGAGPTAATGRAGQATTPPLRVLVVDDNVDAAETLAELLESLGHRARAVFDGESAVRSAGAFRPQLVFLDLGMAAPDGFEVARRLRADPSTSRCFLVALTGWGEPETRERARQAGFDSHMVKPPEIGALLDAIARAHHVSERSR